MLKKNVPEVHELPKPVPPIEKETFELREVATETARVIHNNETGEELDIPTAIVLILNKLEKLEEGIL